MFIHFHFVVPPFSGLDVVLVSNHCCMMYMWRAGYSWSMSMIPWLFNCASCHSCIFSLSSCPMQSILRGPLSAQRMKPREGTLWGGRAPHHLPHRQERPRRGPRHGPPLSRTATAQSPLAAPRRGSLSLLICEGTFGNLFRRASFMSLPFYLLIW